jgi:hypothetical protein
MERWYRVATFGYPRIEAVYVGKSTDKSVWVQRKSPVNYLTERQARIATYHAFFPTLGEAIECGRKHLKETLATHKRHYEYAQEREAEFEHKIATGRVVEGSQEELC